ncbi:M50 family metallopeptidase [Calidifontibacter terrae]
MFLLGVLLLLVGVAVSIALHEIGHLVPAKKSGVKVTQYMVGFGPTIWSRRKGETEYGVKAIPLGGYIRMVGMFPPARGEEEPDAQGNLHIRASSTGRFSQLIDQAREAAYEEITPADRDRVFYKLPTINKLVIMFGGPFMNLVISAVLLTVVNCGIGLPQQVTADIAGVQQCLPTTAKGSTTQCPANEQSPAQQAGLTAKDRIVSIDGVPITTSQQATDVIRRNAGRPIPFVVERAGARRTIQVTPVQRTMPKYDSHGTPVVNWLGETETVRVGVVGAAIGGTSKTHRTSLTEAPGQVWSAFSGTASVFVKIPQKMVGVARAAFGGGTRDANGPVSVVGVGRLAGEVTNAAPAWTDKLAFLLLMVAGLNMALFVFNLVPLLPLDGGHLATALWEALKRAIARARGISGPIYADAAKGMPIAYGVSLLLIVMFVLLAYADIVNPIKL